MRALTATIVTTLTISTACVGGPGPLPTQGDDGEQVDVVQAGGSGDNEQTTSSSGSPSSSGSTSQSCVVSQCPQLSCVCGKFTATVQKCAGDVCAKTCAEAGCSG